MPIKQKLTPPEFLFNVFAGLGKYEVIMYSERKGEKDENATIRTRTDCQDILDAPR